MVEIIGGAGASDDTGGGDGDTFNIGVVDVIVAATGEATGSVPKALAVSKASAFADYGRLAASARIYSDSYDLPRDINRPSDVDVGSGTRASANAIAMWGDEVTFTSPSITIGTEGHFKAVLRVTGDLSVTGSPYLYIEEDGNLLASSYNITKGGVQVGGIGLAGYGVEYPCPQDQPSVFGNIACAWEWNDGQDSKGYYNSLGSELEVNAHFVFGEPISLYYQIALEVFSQAETFTSSLLYTPTRANTLAITDLTQTLLWGGITRVVDDSGQVVTDYSLSSLSGFDYTKPAQKPSLPSVPGPLPLLGVSAAFGFSRKLRKRIKSSKLPVASAID